MQKNRQIVFMLCNMIHLHIIKNIQSDITKKGDNKNLLPPFPYSQLTRVSINEHLYSVPSHMQQGEMLLHQNSQLNIHQQSAQE